MENFKEPGFIGVADDTQIIDQKTLEKAVATAQEPAAREVKIRVPVDLPDHAVFTAWQIGMGTLQRVQMGLMVLAFPTVGKGPKGEPVNMIGRADVLISKQEDIDRIVSLCDVITNVNKELAAAQNNPSDLLAASIKAKQIKDEAARHAQAEAQGHTPIVLATTLPKLK